MSEPTGEPHYGFTGTRRGMPLAQWAALAELLKGRSGWLHHGDCLGADESAHKLAMALGFRVCIHPPTNPAMRANCEGTVVREAKGYIARNHDIVDCCSELIAAPSEVAEQVRSGTWATVRYARRRNKMVTIIYPDGSLGFDP